MKWKKLNPASEIPDLLPFAADKLTSWVYEDKIYVFGGYGPSPPPEMRELYPRNFSFVPDNLNGYVYQRGWNNHLVIYDITKNRFEWPKMFGDIPPPRAAMSSVCCSNGKIFVFGGRLETKRLNDLYSADLKKDTVIWRKIQNATDLEEFSDNVPIGRSWFSFTLVNGEKHALLYGGFDTFERVLSDAWLLNLETCQWKRLSCFDRGQRLWHTAVFSKTMGTVFLIGGVQENLFMQDQGDLGPVTWHPKSLETIQLSPPPLLALTLEEINKNYESLKPMLEEGTILPRNLLNHIERRRQGFGI